jgi:hypothetical protein
MKPKIQPGYVILLRSVKKMTHLLLTREEFENHSVIGSLKQL